ncbi:MAG TPA: hypothetical protein VFN52_05965 [Acidiferrobacteraceae bacterium]|nr:hypothetical protein [Acidiferrobacteraceae bacterium]
MLPAGAAVLPVAGAAVEPEAGAAGAAADGVDEEASVPLLLFLWQAARPKKAAEMATSATFFIVFLPNKQS